MLWIEYEYMDLLNCDRKVLIHYFSVARQWSSPSVFPDSASWLSDNYYYNERT